MPDGVPDDHRPGAPRGILPGLDPELLALIQATAEVELQGRRQPEGHHICLHG